MSNQNISIHQSTSRVESSRTRPTPTTPSSDIVSHADAPRCIQHPNIQSSTIASTIRIEHRSDCLRDGGTQTPSSDIVFPLVWQQMKFNSGLFLT
mmetsp:Transcript_24883/g.53685  ORF Transcript_24883/g.53685 Transcript_24883/m.53685 type:complete len:95 (-) Transcript_24883:2396-2680(-)